MVLNQTDRNQWVRELEGFEAPFLEEKLLEKGVFSSREEYAQMFSEFKRYVALSRLSGKPLGMTSKQVDEVWHQFILFTKEYMAFCDHFLGYYLHHSPRTSSQSLSEGSSENFVRAYRVHFGEIPPVWGIVTKSSSDCGSDTHSCSADCRSCSSDSASSSSLHDCDGSGQTLVKVSSADCDGSGQTLTRVSSADCDGSGQTLRRAHAGECQSDPSCHSCQSSGCESSKE